MVVEQEDTGKDVVLTIMENIKEKEKEFISNVGFDEYTSLEEIPEEELESLDIDDRKIYYDLTEFRSVAENVNDLINAKNATDDKKELHRIKKELEIAIRDLRALKRKKNEESSWAASVIVSLDDLIYICK